MLKILIKLTLFFMYINVTCAGDVFEPYIVESYDKDVCELSLDHYIRLYISPRATVQQVLKIHHPGFSSRRIKGQNSLYTGHRLDCDRASLFLQSPNRLWLMATIDRAHEPIRAACFAGQDLVSRKLHSSVPA